MLQEFLREYAMEIINFKNKWKFLIEKMNSRTKKNSRNHMKMQRICNICKEKFEDIYAEDKKKDILNHCHYTGEYRSAAHSLF